MKTKFTFLKKTLLSVIILTGSMNVSAQTYTVTLDAGDGTVFPLTLTQSTVGAAVTLPNATPSCVDWHFIGWSIYDYGKTARNPAIVSPTYTPTNNITLYARYAHGQSNTAITYDLVEWESWLEEGVYLISYYSSNNEDVFFTGNLNIDGFGESVKVSSSEDKWRYLSLPAGAAEFTLTEFPLIGAGSQYYIMKGSDFLGVSAPASEGALGEITLGTTNQDYWIIKSNSEDDPVLSAKYLNSSYFYPNTVKALFKLWKNKAPEDGGIYLWKKTYTETSSYDKYNSNCECDLSIPVYTGETDVTRWQATINWQPVPDADAYDVYVYNTAAGNKEFLDITNTSLVITDLEPCRSYYFTITAKDGDCKSTYNARFQNFGDIDFIYTESLPQPTNVLPQPQELTSSTTTTITWDTVKFSNASGNGVEYAEYLIYIYTDESDFCHSQIENSPFSSVLPVYDISDLELDMDNDTTYYYRVVSCYHGKACQGVSCPGVGGGGGGGGGSESHRSKKPFEMDEDDDTTIVPFVSSQNNEITAFAEKEQLVVTTKVQADVQIYSVSGQLITTQKSVNGQARFSLPKGMYLIKVNEQTVKFVL
ncbi:MAG: T9SS type A sorting domain-containing protein [Prevotellaceae bacterium]|jgi:hypothetical protein|nr:T9SS type A sorting domain-containing protein [Prevotellaceae bacterium]